MNCSTRKQYYLGFWAFLELKSVYILIKTCQSEGFILAQCVFSNMEAITTCEYFSMYLTKFDAKMTKMKRNYMANMIMNVSGTVWQRIHYFPIKQGLAIHLSWPALKSKRHMCIELFDIIIFNRNQRFLL